MEMLGHRFEHAVTYVNFTFLAGVSHVPSSGPVGVLLVSRRTTQDVQPAACHLVSPNSLFLPVYDMGRYVRIRDLAVFLPQMSLSEPHQLDIVGQVLGPHDWYLTQDCLACM